MFSIQTTVSKPLQKPGSHQKGTHMKRCDKVKAMLVGRDIKQVDIARDLQITRGAVSQVLNGYRNNRRIKEYIAECLGKPYEKVWGKRPDNK